MARWFGADRNTPLIAPVDVGIANVNYALHNPKAGLRGAATLIADGHTILWNKARLEGIASMRALGRTDCTNEVNLPSVDWTPLEADLCTQAVSRLLYQFRNSPVLVQLTCLLNKQMQDLYDVTLDVMRKCEIVNAVGVQLDVMGRRVGCTRLPSSLSDDQYRFKLVAKIFKNHVLYCSPTEIQHYFATAQQRKISVVTVGPMEVDLYVSTCVGETLINELLTFTDTAQCDGVATTPWAATLNVRHVIVMPTGKAFMSDIGNGHEVDRGRAAVISGATI